MESLILAIYFLLFFIAIVNYNSALFFYLFFLPIRSLIDYSIFGVAALNTVFLIILLFHFFRKGLVEKAFSATKKNYKHLMYLTVILFFLSTLTEIRNFILLQSIIGKSFSIQFAISRIILLVGNLIAFIVILNVLLFDFSNRKIIIKGIILSVFFISLSLPFTSLLDSIGFNVRVTSDSLEQDINEVGRVSGLFIGGVNSAGTFLSLSFAFILMYSLSANKSISIKNGIVLLVIFLGVLITASRMAFIMITITLIYYSILMMKIHRISPRSIVNLSFLIILLSAVLLIIAKYNRFGFVFTRIAEQGLFDEMQSSGERYNRWFDFLWFCLSEPNRILFGTSIPFYWSGNTYREVHNYFINLLYINGIFSLIILIVPLVKWHKHVKKMKLFYLIIPLSIIVLLSAITINSDSFKEHYILFMGVLVANNYLTQNNGGYRITT